MSFLSWVVRPIRSTPLAGSYSAAVALALLALCPFIVLSVATLLFTHQLIADLGTTRFGIELGASLSNAGYAFGAVAAADFIQRAPKWAIYVACEAGFVFGSLLCAAAPGVVAFTTGRILQGVATGLLLVVALPPLVTNHGVGKLPLTAMFVNLGLFGMVTLGPVVGGLVGSFINWRWMFVGLAILAAVGAVVGLLGFDRAAPPARGMRFDWSAIPVAAGATVLPFLGVAWLSRGGVTSPGFFVPLIIGLVALGTLLVRQYQKKDALMPMKLITHTLPVTGIAAAMIAGAGFTALIELTAQYLLQTLHYAPAAVGGLLAPQLPGIAAAALLFKRMLTTRWLPVLAFGGLGCVAAGGAAMLTLGFGQDIVAVTIAGFLLGFGAGAGVAPGLFMGALSVPSNRLGPTFGLVELLRSEAAFLVAPVLTYIAMLPTSPLDGIRIGTAIVVALAIAAWLVLLGVLLSGGAHPHAPDLGNWLAGDSAAYESPPLAATLRED